MHKLMPAFINTLYYIFHMVAIFKEKLEIDSIFNAHTTQGDWDGNCDLAVVIKVTEL